MRKCSFKLVYQLVFLAGMFIGSLGAVMDVAISISAALFELYRKNPDISIQKLKASGIAIGKDIMGTMTNILLFAYVSGAMPILILYIKNYSPLGFTLSINLSLNLQEHLLEGSVLFSPFQLDCTYRFLIKRRGLNYEYTSNPSHYIICADAYLWRQ